MNWLGILISYIYIALVIVGAKIFEKKGAGSILFTNVDVEGLLKDRSEEAKKHFLAILEELEELCEGVEEPKSQLEYEHYFCGESGVDIDNDEAFARSREKLYRLVNRLVRAFAEFKPLMSDMGYSSAEQQKFENRVTFFIKLSETIGQASGDFIDLKQYEPGMRYLIDNYIIAFDSEKIGILDDFTLLDFILKNEAANESKGTAIKNIPPFDILKNFFFPLPPLEEQNRIIEKVSYWLSFVNAIDSEGKEMGNLISKTKSKILDLAIHGKPFL